jgi:hypothetical protein
VILVGQHCSQILTSLNAKHQLLGSALQREIDGMEALEYQMSRNVESLRQLKGRADFARTWKGRCFQVLGRMFALYCIVRTLSVSRLISFMCMDQRISHSAFSISWLGTVRSSQPKLLKRPNRTPTSLLICSHTRSLYCPPSI